MSTRPLSLALDLPRLFNLFQAGCFAEMEQLAESLLRLYPGVGMLWKALGVARLAQSRDAVDALTQAAVLLPDDTEIVASLVEAVLRQGHAALRSGHLQDAVDRYTAARQLNEHHPHAHACLGIALRELGRHEAALPSLRRALSLRPDLVDTRFCLGSSLLDLGQADEALLVLREVLASNPHHGPAHANLGNALKAIGQPDEALAAYRRAVELQPDAPSNHANLGAAYRELGQMHAALDCYQRVFDLDPRRLDALSDQLFIQSYLSDTTPSARCTEARRFGALAAAHARPYLHGDAVPLAAPLRVGMVSADLREHPVGYFLESVIAALATIGADQIELFIYVNSDVEDALTARLRRHVRHWISIARLDDEEAAARIHRDKVHVLVDLAGHTAGNRLPLFAWRPAPRQIGWLGYCATTGLEAIDYILADRWIAPPEADVEFTERIWRLPEVFLCFTPPDPAIAVEPLPALGQGYITFGCFNKFNKLNDAVVSTWARVLQAIPASRLLLRSSVSGTKFGRRQLRLNFGRHGIAPERLILEGASPRPDYLRAYGHVDIALDPFPYPGGTTSVEALWMGVPVLTLAGDCALGRQGVGLLQNIGLTDWIAADTDDYVARAVRHAGDLAKLTTLRRELRTRLLSSPLCDAARFARHLVDALRALSAAGRK